MSPFSNLRLAPLGRLVTVVVAALPALAASAAGAPEPPGAPVWTRDTHG